MKTNKLDTDANSCLTEQEEADLDEKSLSEEEDGSNSEVSLIVDESYDKKKL